MPPSFGVHGSHSSARERKSLNPSAAEPVNVQCPIRDLKPPGDASRVTAERELPPAPARSHQSVIEDAEPGFSGSRIRLSPERPRPRSVIQSVSGMAVRSRARRVDQGHGPQRTRVPSVKTLDVKILVAVALSVVLGLSVLWLATSFYGATLPSAIPGR